MMSSREDISKQILSLVGRTSTTEVLRLNYPEGKVLSIYTNAFQLFSNIIYQPLYCNFKTSTLDEYVSSNLRNIRSELFPGNGFIKNVKFKYPLLSAYIWNTTAFEY